MLSITKRKLFRTLWYAIQLPETPPDWENGTRSGETWGWCLLFVCRKMSNADMIGVNVDLELNSFTAENVCKKMKLPLIPLTSLIVSYIWIDCVQLVDLVFAYSCSAWHTWRTHIHNHKEKGQRKMKYYAFTLPTQMTCVQLCTSRHSLDTQTKLKFTTVFQSKSIAEVIPSLLYCCLIEMSHFCE